MKKQDQATAKDKLAIKKESVKDLTAKSGVRAGRKCYDTCIKSVCIGSCVMTR